MAKRLNYTLTGEQLNEIEQAMSHDPRSEVVRRATAIRLLHLGHTPTEVGQLTNSSRATIQNWHQRWREQGLNGLVDKPLSGRPPKANQTYREALAQVLEQDPHELGYSFSVWTLERLSQHLADVTGISLSAGRLATWMNRWGYVYRRPKPDLGHKQDASVREQVQQWLNELKKQRKMVPVAFSLWTKPPSD